MNKKTVVIGIALIGFIFGLTGNSWAAWEKGGHRYQKQDSHHYKAEHSPTRHPAPRYIKPGHNYRYHRPLHWKFHPKGFHRPGHRPVVKQINHYYGSTATDYATEDNYQVSASVSDAEFSFSIGVSGSR